MSPNPKPQTPDRKALNRRSLAFEAVRSFAPALEAVGSGYWGSSIGVSQLLGT